MSSPPPSAAALRSHLHRLKVEVVVSRDSVRNTWYYQVYVARPGHPKRLETYTFDHGLPTQGATNAVAQAVEDVLRAHLLCCTGVQTDLPF